MEPRNSINEIIEALRHPPKTHSGAEHVSLESYYKQWAETAVEALVGAEAAMGQWQDILARTRDELEDTQQRLINTEVTHAITQHRAEQASSVEVTQQWTFHECKPEDIAAHRSVPVAEHDVLDSKEEIFATEIHARLLGLHRLLAARKALRGLGAEHHHLLLAVRYNMDRHRERCGHGVKPLVDSDDVDSGVMKAPKTAKRPSRRKASSAPAFLNEKERMHKEEENAILGQDMDRFYATHKSVEEAAKKKRVNARIKPPAKQIAKT